MKVFELIEKLKVLDQDVEVIMSSDPEGNSHRPCDDVESCMVEKINDWSYDLIHPDDVDGMPLGDEDYVSAVCIWPV